MEQKAKKKPFILRRWSVRLFTWLDNLIFKNYSTEEHASAATPFWATVVINFFLGILVIGITMFMHDQRATMIQTIGACIGLASVVGVTIWYLVGSLKYFNSIGAKIARSVYILVVDVLAFVIAFYSAVFAIFIIIGLFVLWVLYAVVFGGKTKGKRKLSNGVELTEEKGLAGESYFTGSDGREYKQNSDGSFSKQNDETWQ